MDPASCDGAVMAQGRFQTLIDGERTCYFTDRYDDGAEVILGR